MISYVTLGVSNVADAANFYVDLLKDLGATKLIEMDRIVFVGKSMQAPMLAVCVPFNKQEPHPGNGNMLSISPGSKQEVDALYTKALELGATCDGEPGQRIPNRFYGAYIKDKDGNKVCFSHFG